MADFLQTTGQRLVVFYFAIFFSTSLALGACLFSINHSFNASG